MKRFLSALLALAWGLTFAIAPVQAADREDLIKQAEETLDDMAGELRGFAKDANAQDATDAVRLSLALKKTLGELKAVQGDDKTAKAMVKDWPGAVKEFQAAVVDLAKIKNEQLKFGDKPKDYIPPSCKAWQGDLDALIKSSLKSMDPDGMALLSKKGESLGKKASAAMSRARTAFESADDSYDDIKGFGGAKGWNSVVLQVQSEAKTMMAEIASKRKALTSTCEQLAQGRRNPDVVEARKEIAEATGDQVDALQTMVDAWEARAAGYFKLDCQAMQSLHEAYCGADLGDKDNAGDVGKLRGLAKGVSSKLLNDYQDIMDELEVIVELSNDLESEMETRDEAKKIFKELADELAKMKVAQSGGLKGFNHPTVQYYIKFGREMHAKMERKFSCNVRDVAFGSAGRPDCISGKSCTVIEFKPDSKSGKSAGPRQVKKYKNPVEKFYNDFTADLNSPPPSKYGGKAIMQQFDKASGCIKNGKLDIDLDVEYYARCQNKYACIR
ncbi:hypothetical protein ACFL12_05430 [Pseudomonadota bacterium]